MGWNTFALTASSNTSLSSGIAAVSRVPNSMELWSIDNDGSVQDHYWYDGPGWLNFQLAPAGSAAPGSGIAVLSRIPNSMELWWVGQDSSVQGAYWYEGGNWTRYQLAPPGSASLTGGIAAVSRVPNAMELWFVGKDGSVHDYYWYEGGNWQTFELAPAGSASLTSGIAAVSRVPNSMELWWVGQDGSVQGADWYQGGSWARYPLAAAGSASLTSGIAAVSRVPNSMELWFVGQDGSVHDYNWYEGGNWQTFQLAPAGTASLKSGIAAVSRIADSLEVWFVGKRGTLQEYYWQEGGKWESFPLAPAGTASLSTGIAVVSRVPNSVELWFVAADGSSVHDQYWYQDPTSVPALSAIPGSSLYAYWGSAGTRHVNYAAVDGHVHEFYFKPGAGWTDNDLTAASKGALAAPGTAIHSYWGGDSSQHVNFISLDGHVHELYIHPGAGWVDNDLTAASKGALAAPGSALDGYWGSDSSQHVNFISLDGHVHELYIHPGASWVDNDLTAASKGSVAASSSALSAYWGSDSSQHVNFISADGHVHELYIHPGASWVDNDLTGASKGAVAASGSALDSYWGSDSSQHVNFSSLDGHVHELYIHPGASWVDNDLTAASKGPLAASGSPVSGYWGSDSSQHVNFISADGHVQELYIHPGAAWVCNDLTAASKGALAAAPRSDSNGRSHTTARGSALHGYWGSDSSQHVHFISANAHVHELYIHPGAAWVDNDLSVRA